MESGWRELRSPRVEHLHDLRARLDLQGQVLHAQVCYLLEQFHALRWVFVYPPLDLLEDLAPTTFGHVAEEREWGAAEPEQWHSAIQFLPRESDGLVHIVQLHRDIDVPGHYLLVLAIVGAREWVWEVRALLIDHLDRHTHGLWDHQYVGEDDGRVE